MEKITDVLLGKRILGLMMITVLTFISGAALTAYDGLGSITLFPSSIILVLTVFTAGFLFFGYTTPFLMLLVGMHIGKVSKKPSFSILNMVIISVASFLSAYSSIALGNTLLRDMKGKRGFNEALKVTLFIMIISIGLASVESFLL